MSRQLEAQLAEDDIDLIGEQLDLIGECQTDSTIYRDTDGEKKRLREENRIKEKALDKASALIDLLNLELAVSKKAFEEAVQDLKEDLMNKEHAQGRLKEKIKSLEERNNFLEFECKRRNNEPKLAKSTSRTSFKSGGRCPSEQNLRSTARTKHMDSTIKSIASPKRRKEEEISVQYLKTFVQEYCNQDYEHTHLLQSLLQRETANCQSLAERVEEAKAECEQVGSTSAETVPQDSEAGRTMKYIIEDQKALILSYMHTVEEYKRIVHDLVSKTFTSPSNHNPLQQAINILYSVNATLPLKSLQLQSNIHLSSVSSQLQQEQQLTIGNEKLNGYLKLWQSLKESLSLGMSGGDEELLLRIKQLKSSERKLQEENKELVSITEGLLKYIKY